LKALEAKVFLEMGYPNLFSYLTQALKLTEAQRIVLILTKENHQEWISKAQSLSKYDLEREVAELNPLPPKKGKP